MMFQWSEVPLRPVCQYSSGNSIVVTVLSDMIVESTRGRQLTLGYDFEDYHDKVNRYVHDHRDDGVIYKLNRNIPLDKDDVTELTRILTEELGTKDDYVREYGQEDFGVMIRKIVKLDHQSVMEAFSKFINDASLNQQQIQFIHKIIQYVENEGVMDVGDLLKSPFDKPVSFTRMFDTRIMTELIDTIKSINSNASTASDS